MSMSNPEEIAEAVAGRMDGRIIYRGWEIQLYSPAYLTMRVWRHRRRCISPADERTNWVYSEKEFDLEAKTIEFAKLLIDDHIVTSRTSLGKRIRRTMLVPPYRFQKKGIRFLESRGGRAIIGDDMGLGKTYQSIAYAALHPEARPILVECTASIKWKWQREFMEFAGLESAVAEGKAPPPGFPLPEILIINYDILPGWRKFIRRMDPKLLILDEVQKLRGFYSQRSEHSREISRTCPWIIPLSGTLVMNRPIELFPVLNILDPESYPSIMKYALRYCEPKMDRGKWDMSGAAELEELHARIKPLMIRRLKKDVDQDLPKKTRSIVPLHIPMAKYRKAVDDFQQWARIAAVEERLGVKKMFSRFRIEAIAKIGHLRRLVGRAKLPLVVEWIDDFLESGEKLIVFAIHKKVVRGLCAAFPDALRIDGSTPPAKRQAISDQFQNDPKRRLIVGNIEAMGVGINLTAAWNVAVVEFPWVPADLDQAEDRANRIGQVSRHVQCWYFLAMDTIEERIVLPKLEKKRKVVGKILDGDEKSMNVPTRVLEHLMKGTGNGQA